MAVWILNKQLKMSHKLRMLLKHVKNTFFLSCLRTQWGTNARATRDVICMWWSEWVGELCVGMCACVLILCNLRYDSLIQGILSTRSRMIQTLGDHLWPLPGFANHTNARGFIFQSKGGSARFMIIESTWFIQPIQIFDSCVCVCGEVFIRFFLFSFSLSIMSQLFVLLSWFFGFLGQQVQGERYESSPLQAAVRQIICLVLSDVQLILVSLWAIGLCLICCWIVYEVCHVWGRDSLYRCRLWCF